MVFITAHPAWRVAGREGEATVGMLLVPMAGPGQLLATHPDGDRWGWACPPAWGRAGRSRGCRDVSHHRSGMPDTIVHAWGVFPGSDLSLVLWDFPCRVSWSVSGPKSCGFSSSCKVVSDAEPRG